MTLHVGNGGQKPWFGYKDFGNLILAEASHWEKPVTLESANVAKTEGW